MPDKKKIPHAINTSSSIAVTNCQNCSNSNLSSIIFLGFLPPVNKLSAIDTIPQEQPSYPAQLLYCNNCKLVQLGLIVDPKIIFPSEYPYTSGTTKILRENFSQLYRESTKLLTLQKNDLIVDIGSNDGTLLSNFTANHKVLGITPEDIGKEAIKKGIPTIIDYFTPHVAKEVVKKYGQVKVVTATNVFAHMEQIHEIIDGIEILLGNNGVFISESHYLLPLIKRVEYDTIYHEHMRYYSLISLQNLLAEHDLEIFYAKEIPTHGGSFRAYAAKKGLYPINPSVKRLLKKEKEIVTSKKAFENFRKKTVLSKLALHALLLKLKKKGASIYGISAAARASTLINYTKLNEDIIDCVVEVKGSHKIGYYVPGTLIPIFEEEKLVKYQPKYALILSWHIADELMPKLKKKGFKGDFIIPLPYPKIILNKNIAS